MAKVIGAFAWRHGGEEADLCAKVLANLELDAPTATDQDELQPASAAQWA